MYKGNESIGRRIEMAYCETILAIQRCEREYGADHLPSEATVTVDLTNEVRATFTFPIPRLPREPQSAPTQSTVGTP